MRLTEPRAAAPWWREGVLYQIYPRSFADTNGDGVGDLRGVIERLDYLEWLGIDGIWLNPVTVSPDADFGYDVADYEDVQPLLGTLADVGDLVAEAGGRGIRILFDIVPNHTSDRHPWFVDSRSSRDSRYREWYVWADPKPDGSPPNNWISVFGGPAWTLDEQTGQHYLHNFLAEQPDLNWWNEEVREAFDRILRFWFDRGIAGFRIDVAHAIVKDRELRDNLPLGEDDPPELARFEQARTFNMNRPEVHDVHRRWRALCETYDPPRILLGETYVLNLEAMAAYYGSGDDELNLAFNFPFVHAPFRARSLRAVVEATETVLPPTAWPVWTGSNHDIVRFPTRCAAATSGRCAARSRRSSRFAARPSSTTATSWERKRSTFRPSGSSIATGAASRTRAEVATARGRPCAGVTRREWASLGLGWSRGSPSDRVRRTSRREGAIPDRRSISAVT